MRWLVQKPKSDERDAALDVLLVALGDVLSADVTLSGAVDYMSISSPEFLTETVEGAPAIKAAVVPIILEYTTLTPNGYPVPLGFVSYDKDVIKRTHELFRKQMAPYYQDRKLYDAAYADLGWPAP